MPIKKDETGKRWVEMEVIVPGTIERVQQSAQERSILLCLNTPIPGIALIAIDGAGNATNASMALYL